jgi:hypothetical protein
MIQHEAKVYSQNGEDGILAHIFGTINHTNRIAVEFGVGRGHENNSRLLGNLGWSVVWFDCTELTTKPPHCLFRQRMLTVDNICQEFQAAQVPQEFDLLSIDVDGNDYHLREALSWYRPRVCVMEYNGCFGPDEEYIMPRNDQYQWRTWEKNFGASLLSLTQQASRLGYDLVYCEKQGVNAFYVRRDINLFFPVLSVQQAWRPLWWASRV